MKLFTSNQLKFAGTLALLTVAFRFGLSALLDHKEFSPVWVIAVLYGVLIFIAGWIFGKKDHESIPLYDIGFRFHLTTYIVYNILSELWFMLGFHSQYENIKVIHLTVFIWGICIVIHFIFFLISRKDTIKGLEKSEIFE
jgi:hypothetical protein